MDHIPGLHRWSGGDPGRVGRTPLKAISLFSGVGGFEIGFDRAGIETVLHAENDPHCLSVLARHWPQVEKVNDVRVVGQDWTIHGGTAPRHRDIDIAYGGFPCQDLSPAGSIYGKRDGLRGSRSNLWFEFERVLSVLSPRWAVIENVPGLLSSNGGADFAIILNALDELGFDAAWAVLDAQHFGVPQRRRRVFIVAGPRGRSAEQVLSLCEGCGGNPEAGRTTEQKSAASIDPSPTCGVGLIEGHTLNGVARTLTVGGSSGQRFDPNEETYVLSENTVRRLTMLERERLMGWPDDHTRWASDGREITDGHRSRMTGNGVAAPVAEWIGHRIVAVDRMLRAA